MTFILSKDYALGVEIWMFGIGIFWVLLEVFGVEDDFGGVGCKGDCVEN